MDELAITLNGRVQGVNFRANVKDFADEHGIRGYVKNQEDGSVFISAQASENKLKEFAEWLKSSPGFSRVERVDIQNKKSIFMHKDFKIKRDDGFFKDKMKSINKLVLASLRRKNGRR